MCSVKFSYILLVKTTSMSMLKFPNLFSPLTIKDKTFINRILISPVGINEKGSMSEHGTRFYDEIAI